MNDINFIKPIPPKKQETLNRWFLCTLYASIVTISLLSLATAYRVINLLIIKHQQKKLHATLQNLEPALMQVHSQQEQQELLTQKLKKIARLKTNPKLPTPYLQELSRIMPPDVALTNYKQEKKQISLEGKALQTNAVLALVQQLQNSSLFKDMQLAAMQHEKNGGNGGVSFTLKGKIVDQPNTLIKT